MSEPVSIKEVKAILRQINECKSRAKCFDDKGECVYDEQCTIEIACDDCIERIIGLLDWADDEAPSATVASA
jgi:hypothetical protein